MYNYRNYLKPDQKNIDPGYSNTVWVAPLSWFAILQEPVLPGVAAGDTVTIKLAHTFTVGKGFLKFRCAPDSTGGDGSFVGIPGALRPKFDPTMTLLGDSPELFEQLKEIANEDLIILMKNATCPEGQVIQFGCDCSPCSLRTAPFTSGKTNEDQGAKKWELTFNAPCKYFYTAAITELPVA